MAADSFTEVTSESWFGRIGGAIKGVLAGIVLIVVAVFVLFWNEGRAVKRHKTLKEGASAVVTVGIDQVDPASEGALVHLSGLATTEATLTDPVFGMSANALKLSRKSEMYQWEESSSKKTRKKLGGGTETTTTYDYKETWSTRAIDSSSFKKPEGHQNPGSMPHGSQSWLASDATVGAFRLSASLVGRIGGARPLVVSAPPQTSVEAQVHAGGLYIGANPTTPAVGDVRVSFSVVEPADVSVIARQTSDGLTPYMTKVGGTIELLEMGLQSSEAMIQEAQASNQRLTWILRLVGLIVLAIACGLILKPLSVLADVIPLLGNIVEFGTGIIAFISALTIWLVTVAVAWVVYRPLFGIGLLVLAGGIVVLVLKKMKSRAA